MINILVFSALTGISFSFALSATGGSTRGINFLVFDYFAQFFDANIQTMILIISSIFTIFFIFRLSRFFKEVYEHKLAGIGTAVCGFSGSFIVILVPQENSHVLILGISAWLIGLIISIFFRRKN